MLGILPNLQAKYILLQNGPSWDRNVCIGLHRTTRIQSLLVSLQGTHLPLWSVCSVFANSKRLSLQAHNLGRRGAEHSNFREYREQKVSFRCLVKMQRGAYMNFMGFSWMVCVSMLKIGYVFQRFFYVMWIVVYDIIFHVKRSQQSLENDLSALV